MSHSFLIKKQLYACVISKVEYLQTDFTKYILNSCLLKYDILTLILKQLRIQVLKIVYIIITFGFRCILNFIVIIILKKNIYRPIGPIVGLGGLGVTS